MGVGSTLHCGRARKSPRVADFVIDGTHAVLIFCPFGSSSSVGDYIVPEHMVWAPAYKL